MTKRILTLLIAVFALGIFSSCEGPAGRDGIDGENATPTTWHIKFFTVDQRDWVYDNDENVYIYDIPVNELSEDIAFDGAVLVSMVFNENVFYSLPYTGFYTGSTYYSETTTFDYSTGYVRVKVGASDAPIYYQPKTTKFKITLIY